MTSRKVLVVLALALPLCVAAQGPARGQQFGGPHWGDEASSLAPFENSLTVCCQSFYTPPAAPTAAALFEPTAVGCTAIPNNPDSLNWCKGVLLGCSVAAFICQPSATVKHAKDCTCANIGPISPVVK
jgi:hypothetical protein